MTARKAVKPAKAAKKKDGRGGARPGAGRKPKPKVIGDDGKSKPVPKKPVRLARVAMASPEQVERARKYAGLAMDALADLAVNAVSENARRQAAVDLLEWGFGEPSGIGNETLRQEERAQPKEKPMGKKEALVEAAKNPDTSDPMGRLLAERQAQANQKLDS